MKVLVATDGSRYAQRAAAFLGSRLHFERSAAVDVIAVSEPDLSPRLRSRPASWVEDAASLLRAGGVNPVTSVVGGDPAETLVRRSAEYDLVVVGVKGRGATPFFEIGRVSLALLREGRCSVLLVRDRLGGAAASDAGEASPFRIIVPAEGGEDGGLGSVWELSGAFAGPGAEVEIVTVMESPPLRDRVVRTDPTSHDGSGRTAVRSQAHRWLQSTVRTLSTTTASPRPVVLEGRPAREIGRRAQVTGSELIVVGCRGNGRPAGPLGRTARELAWSAPCSVLLVRT